MDAFATSSHCKLSAWLCCVLCVRTVVHGRDQQVYWIFPVDGVDEIKGNWSFNTWGESKKDAQELHIVYSQ